MEIFRTSNHKVLLKNRKNKSLFKIQLKLRRSKCDGNSFMCFSKENGVFACDICVGFIAAFIPSNPAHVCNESVFEKSVERR